MLGDVKKTFRGAAYLLQDAKLAIHNRSTVYRYYRLRGHIFRPGYSFHCRPDLKLIYIEIPKAASRTMLHLLGRTRTVRDLGLSRFFALADHPDTIVFTIARNPFERLASCYRNKFQGTPVRALGGYRHDLRRHFGLALRGLRRDEPLSFAQFIDLACATCETGTDGHWLQMNRIVPVADVAPHFVGRVESLDRDLLQLANRLPITAPIPRLNSTGHDDLWTPALRTRVLNAYRIDFERFGY
jgi:hypothetical protein